MSFESRCTFRFRPSKLQASIVYTKRIDFKHYFFYGSTFELPGTQQAPRRGILVLRVRDEQPVSRQACHIRHACRPKTNVRRLAREGQVRGSRGRLGAMKSTICNSLEMQ